jgi:hypothetical protein
MLIKVEVIETGKPLWINAESFDKALHKSVVKAKPKARKKNAKSN